MIVFIWLLKIFLSNDILRFIAGFMHAWVLRLSSWFFIALIKSYSIVFKILTVFLGLISIILFFIQVSDSVWKVFFFHQVYNICILILMMRFWMLLFSRDKIILIIICIKFIHQKVLFLINHIDLILWFIKMVYIMPLLWYLLWFFQITCSTNYRNFFLFKLRILLYNLIKNVIIALIILLLGILCNYFTVHSRVL